MRKNAKWTLITVSILLLVLLFNNQQLASRLFGESKYINTQMRPGNVEVPVTKTLIWSSQSAFADSICNQWADKSISDKIP